MSGFTKTVTREIEFDGDTITVKLRRLSRADMAKFTAYAKEDSDGNYKVAIDEGLEMINIAAEILPNYVVEFQGLKAEDGELLTLDDILEEAYFMNLIGEIIGQLMEISLPNQDDEKK